MRKIQGLLLCLPLFLLFDSCTYTPGTAIPKDFRTIYIYKIFNETTEPDVGVLMKDELYDQFSVDGRLIPIEDPDKADLLLAVRIQDYSKAAASYSPQGLPDQMVIGMEVKLVLQNVGTQQLVNNQVIKDKILFNLITPPISTENDIKKQLVDSLAKKIMLFSIVGFY